MWHSMPVSASTGSDRHWLVVGGETAAFGSPAEGTAWAADSKRDRGGTVESDFQTDIAEVRWRAPHAVASASVGGYSGNTMTGSAYLGRPRAGLHFLRRCSWV